MVKKANNTKSKTVAGAFGVKKQQEQAVESIADVQVVPAQETLVHDAHEAITGFIAGEGLQESARKILITSFYMQHKLDTVYPTSSRGSISLVEGYGIDGKAERGAKSEFYTSLLAHGCDYREDKPSGAISTLIKEVVEVSAILVLFGTRFNVPALDEEGKLLNVEYTEAGSLLIPANKTYSNWGYSQAKAIAKAIKAIDNPVQKVAKTSQAVNGQPIATSEEASEVSNPIEKVRNLASSLRSITEEIGLDVASGMSPAQIVELVANLEYVAAFWAAIQAEQEVAQENTTATQSEVA